MPDQPTPRRSPPSATDGGAGDAGKLTPARRATPVEPRATSPAEPFVRTRRRRSGGNPAVWVAGVAAAVSLVVGVVWVAATRERPDKPTDPFAGATPVVSTGAGLAPGSRDNKPQIIEGVVVLAGVSKGPEDTIIIMASVKVDDPSRVVDFKGWGRFSQNVPLVIDSFGNRCPPENNDLLANRVLAGASGQFDGMADYGQGRVIAGKPRIEGLVLLSPAAAATHVDIDLPGSAVGVQGTYRFRLPLK